MLTHLCGHGTYITSNILDFRSEATTTSLLLHVFRKIETHCLKASSHWSPTYVLPGGSVDVFLLFFCLFFLHAQSVTFLGFVASKDRLGIDPSKVQVVVKLSHAILLQLVQSCLGIIQFFQPFMQNFCTTTVLLPGAVWVDIGGPGATPMLQLPDPGSPLRC